MAVLQAEVQMALSQAAADGATWNRKVMELQVSSFLLDRCGCWTLAVQWPPPPPEAAPLVSYHSTFLYCRRAAGSGPANRAELCWKGSTNQSAAGSGRASWTEQAAVQRLRVVSLWA